MAVAAIWTMVSIIDLHDGHTYNERGRYRAGAKWYPVTAGENPSAFRAIVMLRFGMPVVLLGTIGSICLTGALAQPKGPHS